MQNIVKIVNPIKITKNIPKFTYKKDMKTGPQLESYVKSPNQSQQQEQKPLNVKIHNCNTDGPLERGLRGQKPIPQSPVLGPVLVKNPKIGSKKYRWCTCGLSLNQPWCDGSHFGTEFKPLRFTVEEAVKELHLCGCKFTTEAPFCDQNTCKNMLNSEQEHLQVNQLYQKISPAEQSEEDLELENTNKTQGKN